LSSGRRRTGVRIKTWKENANSGETWISASQGGRGIEWLYYCHNALVEKKNQEAREGVFKVRRIKDRGLTISRGKRPGVLFFQNGEKSGRKETISARQLRIIRADMCSVVTTAKRTKNERHGQISC